LKIKNLRRLSLDRCAIGDTGLQHLPDLENLDALSISRTQVTREGLKAFRLARPDVIVRSDLD
jgi:hypothetical protein